VNPSVLQRLAMRFNTLSEPLCSGKCKCSIRLKEVILTGVHLGGYGSDIQQNLSDLIQAILDQTSVPRLRLGSLEPWDLPENFFDLFSNPRLMPHLHLPLQSGSDSVLKRMARRCKTEEFTQIVIEARAKVPHINITTDIIVGFPGETEQEWQDSFNYGKSQGSKEPKRKRGTLV
jgi:threonylcarbamoyladenosine tRNA methylthiotransferase MtaB